jgi:GNAT superfamily N-acetyltransferase
MADPTATSGSAAQLAVAAGAADAHSGTARVADATLGEPLLDNATWASLTGPHLRFAQRLGAAARYLPEVSPFLAMLDHRDPQSWADAARLVGPGNRFTVAGPGVQAPQGWSSVPLGGGVQLVDVGLAKVPDPEAVRLAAADVPEMLELVARTRPGPFAVRTVELGCYLGIRRGDRLVAMAGERMHPAGWTEISAVCTDPAFRGQGLGRRLVSAVGAVIAGRGDRVFLNASATNTTAIRLHESIGFRLRMRTDLVTVTVP